MVGGLDRAARWGARSLASAGSVARGAWLIHVCTCNCNRRVCLSLRSVQSAQTLAVSSCCATRLERVQVNVYVCRSVRLGTTPPVSGREQGKVVSRGTATGPQVRRSKRLRPNTYRQHSVWQARSCTVARHAAGSSAPEQPHSAAANSRRLVPGCDWSSTEHTGGAVCLSSATCRHCWPRLSPLSPPPTHPTNNGQRGTLGLVAVAQAGFAVLGRRQATAGGQERAKTGARALDRKWGHGHGGFTPRPARLLHGRPLPRGDPTLIHAFGLWKRAGGPCSRSLARAPGGDRACVRPASDQIPQQNDLHQLPAFREAGK